MLFVQAAVVLRELWLVAHTALAVVAVVVVAVLAVVAGHNLVAAEDILVAVEIAAVHRRLSSQMVFAGKKMFVLFVCLFVVLHLSKI